MAVLVAAGAPKDLSNLVPERILKNIPSAEIPVWCFASFQ